MNDKYVNMLKYRITGPQSVNRIQPLLKNILTTTANNHRDHVSSSSQCSWTEESVPLLPQQVSDSPPIPFVWETYCEKSWKLSHDNAIVLNRLHNSNIIEDKANLAFLQLKMMAHKNQNALKIDMLETYIAANKNDVYSWSNQRWNFNDCHTGYDNKNGSGSCIDNVDAVGTTPSALSSSSLSSSALSRRTDNDWWVVKASKGNGGKDIWITNSDRYMTVCKELPVNEEFVIQKYVYPPLLYQNKKKFHFRCYAMMMADGSAYFYENGFILTASNDYQSTQQQSSDSHTCFQSDNTTNEQKNKAVDDNEMQFTRRHITNLSVNKNTTGHPGQIPCHLPTEYPQLFVQMKGVWSAVVEASRDYIRYQRSPHHFDFYGLDFIATDNTIFSTSVSSSNTTSTASAANDDDDDAVLTPTNSSTNETASDHNLLSSSAHTHPQSPYSSSPPSTSSSRHTCWLLEVNRLPGLESSNNTNKPQEDELYDTMLTGLLKRVLVPVFSGAAPTDTTVVSASSELAKNDKENISCNDTATENTNNYENSNSNNSKLNYTTTSSSSSSPTSIADQNDDDGWQQVRVGDDISVSPRHKCNDEAEPRHWGE